MHALELILADGLPGALRRRKFRIVAMVRFTNEIRLTANEVLYVGETTGGASPAAVDEHGEVREREVWSGVGEGRVAGRDRVR